MNTRLLPLVLAITLAATGCVVHVADDGADGAAIAQCSISCPADGRASVRCAAPEVPSCDCTPAPAAACLGPARPARLL